MRIVSLWGDFQISKGPERKLAYHVLPKDTKSYFALGDSLLTRREWHVK